MSHSLGNCPACNQPLAEQDDIVICPDCGAPYHRSCYQKAGHCLFYEQHGPGFEYKNPNQSESESAAPPPPPPPGSSGQDAVLCRACGTPNNANNIFCQRCGSPLHNVNAAGVNGPGFGFSTYAPQMDMTGEIDGISKADWAKYIGRNSQQYIMRMEQQDQRKSKIGIVFSAFFLSPFYFAYRKMWGWAILSFILSTLASVPTFLEIMVLNQNPLVAGLQMSTVSVIMQVTSFVYLAIRILLGMFATYLYRKNAGKKIKALRNSYPDNTAYNNALQKKGDVSMLGVALVVLGMVAVSAAATPFIWQDVLAYMESIESMSMGWF